MTDFDVIVVGGGPAGLSLTAMLAQRGVRCLCLDRDAPAMQGRAQFDGRTTAVAAAAADCLRAAGVWAALETQASPILSIRVTEQGAPRHLHFDHQEAGEAFGWIVENRLLRAALWARVKALPAAALATETMVEDIAVTGTGAAVTGRQAGKRKTWRARLVIGADGRQSFCRQWAGIPWHGAPYRQAAVVCTIAHSLPHAQAAVEDFLPQGPLASLPMTGQRSSIVWTQGGEAARLLQTMPAADFCARLEAHLGMMLGGITLAGDRFVYPLGIYHAARYTAPRLALAGEAAHVMHPIAGQGFNLSMRDNQCLAEQIGWARGLGLDIGSAAVLARYSRLRRADNVLMLAATDGLDRFFSNTVPGLGLLRQLGLAGVERIPRLKRFFMQAAMGRTGGRRAAQAGR